MTTRATDIAEFLETRGATATAGQRASAVIAAAWADRAFWWSATADPTRQCVADSPGMAGDLAELVDQLARHCGVHIHPVPEWEPR